MPDVIRVPTGRRRLPPFWIGVLAGSVLVALVLITT
jgi:hypothetical protein